MRLIQLVLVTWAGIALPLCVTAQVKVSDEQAVRKTIPDLAAAWNDNDMERFGRLFTPDAEYVVITGKYMKGRAEIQSYHADLLAQLYKGSKLASTPFSVRFIKRDVALVHATFEVSYNGGKDRRSTSALVVIAKRGGRWLIESVHNTLTGGTPVQPRASD